MTAVRFMSNIPNPYNIHLYRALREAGLLAGVAYLGMPELEGRPWQLTLEDREHVTPNIRANFAEAWRSGQHGEHLILSGGYRSAAEVARTAAGAVRVDSLFFWGERLRAGGLATSSARRLAFAPYKAVLAVGTWAVPSYRACIASKTLVHVFPYTTTAERPVRRSLSGRPTYGFVGSLIHRKGLDRIITALAEIPLRGRPVFEIVGSGPEGSALARQADALGVAILWLGERSQEWIDHRRLTWWAQVVPSRYDGWGVVVPEALTAGIPVLASPHTGAARDLIRNGVNGQIVADAEWTTALLAYTSEDRSDDEGEAARAVGLATSSEAAARWLPSVLDAKTEQNFIADAWSALV